MLSLKIRRAALHDLQTLIAHRRGMWLDMGYKEKKEGYKNKSELKAADQVYRRWARERLKTGELIGFIVEANGQVAGSGCVWLRSRQPKPGNAKSVQPYLLSMYTENAYRGKGIATIIAKEAIRWAKTKGFPQMTLHASDMGRSIYEKLGFVQTWEMKLDLMSRKKRK